MLIGAPRVRRALGYQNPWGSGVRGASRPSEHRPAIRSCRHGRRHCRVPGQMKGKRASRLTLTAAQRAFVAEAQGVRSSMRDAGQRVTSLVRASVVDPIGPPTVVLGLACPRRKPRVPRVQSSVWSTGAMSRQSEQRGIVIDPLWIIPLDRNYFPLPYPVLQRFLALDRLVDVSEGFVMHELGHTKAARECGAATLAMGRDASEESVRHPDVERAVLSARETIDPVGLHDSVGLDRDRRPCGPLGPSAQPEHDKGRGWRAEDFL